jgi:hypothetical protein
MPVRARHLVTALLSCTMLPNAALDLVNFERQQARVVFGFNF